MRKQTELSPITKMATSFKKTPLLNPLVKFGEKSTADTLYWNNLDVSSKLVKV